MFGFGILSGLLVLPLVGAGFVLLQKDDEAGLRNARWGAFWTTIVTFLLSLVALARFDATKAGFQLIETTADILRHDRGRPVLGYVLVLGL